MHPSIHTVQSLLTFFSHFLLLIFNLIILSFCSDETFTDIADIEPSVTPSSKDDAVVFEGAANANAVALSTPGLVFGLFCFARILL